MTAKDYIISKLESIKEFQTKFLSNKEATAKEEIYRLLMSKRFRKYSIPEKNKLIIKNAIEKNLANNDPIKISWPFGGYKLWRLDESPEADWAELFSLIYISKWLAPICATYEKGVIFTFWFDEVVISRMNNIPESDLIAYRESFIKVLDFIKPWLPSNLKFEIFLEREQYESIEDFNHLLDEEMRILRAKRGISPEPLTAPVIQSIEMNVKATEDQLNNCKWKEDIDIMHNAYYNLQAKQTKMRLCYTEENITAFPVLFDPNVIPIGTVKTSIVRFWVGIGVLEKRGESFIENVLSISQIKNGKFDWEPVNINGLSDRNFSKIRIVK